MDASHPTISLSFQLVIIAQLDSQNGWYVIIYFVIINNGQIMTEWLAVSRHPNAFYLNGMGA